MRNLKERIVEKQSLDLLQRLEENNSGASRKLVRLMTQEKEHKPGVLNKKGQETLSALLDEYPPGSERDRLVYGVWVGTDSASSKINQSIHCSEYVKDNGNKTVRAVVAIKN